jgi:hypothetical protein
MHNYLFKRADSKEKGSGITGFDFSRGIDRYDVASMLAGGGLSGLLTYLLTNKTGLSFGVGSAGALAAVIGKRLGWDRGQIKNVVDSVQSIFSKSQPSPENKNNSVPTNSSTDTATPKVTIADADLENLAQYYSNKYSIPKNIVRGTLKATGSAPKAALDDAIKNLSNEYYSHLAANVNPSLGLSFIRPLGQIAASKAVLSNSSYTMPVKTLLKNLITNRAAVPASKSFSWNTLKVLRPHPLYQAVDTGISAIKYAPASARRREEELEMAKEKARLQEIAETGKIPPVITPLGAAKDVLSGLYAPGEKIVLGGFGLTDLAKSMINKNTRFNPFSTEGWLRTSADHINELNADTAAKHKAAPVLELKPDIYDKALVNSVTNQLKRLYPEYSPGQIRRIAYEAIKRFGVDDDVDNKTYYTVPGDVNIMY